jgi:hypothetical protein
MLIRKQTLLPAFQRVQAISSPDMPSIQCPPQLSVITGFNPLPQLTTALVNPACIPQNISESPLSGLFPSSTSEPPPPTNERSGTHHISAWSSPVGVTTTTIPNPTLNRYSPLTHTINPADLNIFLDDGPRNNCDLLESCEGDGIVSGLGGGLGNRGIELGMGTGLPLFANLNGHLPRETHLRE